MANVRPAIDDQFASSQPGVYVIGDLAGSPVVKLAMEQGFDLASNLLRESAEAPGGAYDAVIIGAGAAGLNCALELHARGRRVVVLEKDRIGSTVANLPEGKWIYTEPEDRPVRGRLPLVAAVKDDVVATWRRAVEGSGLEVRELTTVVRLTRDRGGVLTVETAGGGSVQARRVIVATGKFGSPSKLGVQGEDLPFVQHRLFQTKKYHGDRIVVVGGGNSAVEAAVALAAQNQVTISYRGAAFQRVTKENLRRLRETPDIEVRFNSKVTAFRPGVCEMDGREQPCDHAFVLIGSEAPRDFLKALGIRLEDEWDWKRWALLAAMCVLSYTIYGVKQGEGHEFWPYTGWGAQFFAFGGRPWSFWYTVLYTALVTIFGIRGMKRWGFDHKDKFQIWRYASLIGFQWIFFFLIPEFLFQSAVANQWVGERLASDSNFVNNAWRSYGIIYAWPLFFYTFLGNPADIWVIWGVLLSFVVIPVLVLFQGKRYCTWMCGCGGLAETLGDRWRHLAPKGRQAIWWERMNVVVLIAAALITVALVAHDLFRTWQSSAQHALVWYKLIVDTWLVGIIPIALYPFFGGKIWCRYWCPLAKMMEWFSAAFTRFRVSRFAIASTDKCIACGECSRYCQVGIDVMSFALKQEDLTNSNSSCIGCGICVTVCPMDVLSFARPRSPLVQIQGAVASTR